MSSTQETSVGAGTALLVLDYLSRRGSDREAIASAAGLEESSLAPGARIPRSANLAIWRAAVDETGDDALGLHVAQFAQPGALGLVEYLARTAGSLEESVSMASEFGRLLHDGVELSAEDRGETIEVRHRTLDGRPQLPAAADFAAAYLICIARQLVGFSFGLRSIALARPRPDDVGEWERFYRCEVTFGAAANTSVLDTAEARRPLARADPNLHALLRGQAEAAQADLPAPNDFVDRVRAALRETLVTSGGRTSALCSRLGLSERTLRRRLEEHGLNLTSLRDGVRRAHALDLEARGTWSQADVAAELGFSSTGAYRRAFARWTGASPRAWRARHRAD